jgi:hypothetical protein
LVEETTVLTEKEAVPHLAHGSRNLVGVRDQAHDLLQDAVVQVDVGLRGTNVMQWKDDGLGVNFSRH